jgi:hypothetical protein
MDMATVQHTPAACDPLGSDKDAKPFDEIWSYCSTAGMRLYVCYNTQPNLQFAVHQVCQFAHIPKKSHGQAVKKIIGSLVKAQD